MSDADAKPLRRTSFALMGGLRASGPVRVPDRVFRLTTIGGMDLDLSEAEFSVPWLTIITISLIGGVELTVPADARVTIHRFAIGGRKVEPDPPGATGPEIVVHSYGLIGGAKVRRRRGSG
ncbi:MAG TPA: hypothetical protein VGC32_01540 [Solirubrobacterales bacterium]